MKESQFSDVPIDILVEIFEHIPCCHDKSLALVCKKFSIAIRRKHEKYGKAAKRLSNWWDRWHKLPKVAYIKIPSIARRKLATLQKQYSEEAFGFVSKGLIKADKFRKKYYKKITNLYRLQRLFLNQLETARDIGSYVHNFVLDYSQLALFQYDRENYRQILEDERRWELFNRSMEVVRKWAIDEISNNEIL